MNGRTERRIHATRTAVGSTLRYSAIPPQTPAIILFDELLYTFFVPSCMVPPGCHLRYALTGRKVSARKEEILNPLCDLCDSLCSQCPNQVVFTGQCISSKKQKSRHWAGIPFSISHSPFSCYTSIISFSLRAMRLSISFI